MQEQYLWIVVKWLFIGVILAELSLRSPGEGKKLQPLAYFFIVTLWPVVVPAAVVLTIVRMIRS